MVSLYAALYAKVVTTEPLGMSVSVHDRSCELMFLVHGCNVSSACSQELGVAVLCTKVVRCIVVHVVVYRTLSLGVIEPYECPR